MRVIMATPDLYRLAGPSTWLALVALVLSGIALALFFGGAGEYWGPVNDALVVVTAMALIPVVLAVSRIAGERGGPWVVILTALTVAGLLVIAVGQTLLIVGALSLDGSYVTGGVGILPFLGWMLLVAVLALGERMLPASIGWLAIGSIAAIVVVSVMAVVTSGPLPWMATVGLVVILMAWLASLARAFGPVPATS
jgi:hypothetical protein